MQQRRRSGQTCAAAALLVLLAAAGIAAPRAAAQEEPPSPSPSSSPSLSLDGEGQLQLEFPANRNANDQPVLTVTRETLAGRDIFYEVPQQPKGLYVFFHGCAHNAYDQWPRQEGCEECRGLPGEVALTKQALALGYAFAAINSLDRNELSPDLEYYKCFSYSADKDSAADAIRQLRSNLGFDDKPMYFGGVSSGGGFAMKLAAKEMFGEVSGITSMVLGLDVNKEEYIPFEDFPPIAFIAMTNDTSMVQRITQNQEAMNAIGTPCQTIKVAPRVVYWPTYFSDFSSNITPEVSAKIVSALVDIGVIDELGYVTDDPRHGFDDLDWRSELTALVPELDGSDPADSLTPDSSDVYELLNLAYAHHDIDGEYFTAIMKWMEGGFTGDLTQLAQKYIIRRPSALTGNRLQPGQVPPTSGDPPVTPWIPPPAALGMLGSEVPAPAPM